MKNNLKPAKITDFDTVKQLESAINDVTCFCEDIFGNVIKNDRSKKMPQLVIFPKGKLV